MANEPSSLEVLGESVTKLLSDKLYDKRKQAAMEIEARVKDLMARGNGVAQVQRIHDCLRRDYLDSPQVNHRKGGLIGSASIAIGMDSEVVQILPRLVGPVLDLFKDDEPRVRYYACEAMYNISKVSGESILAYFNEVFDGLFKLYADVDTDVKNGANLLDRLMKDIVTQRPSKFRAATFVPLLAQRMQFKNPNIRQLVLAWIQLLLKVPDADMIRYLPQYLDGLFNLLGDQTRDIRHNADACISACKKEVSSSPPERALQIASEAAPIVVKACFAADPCSRLVALCWLDESVHLQTQRQTRSGEIPNSSWAQILPELLRGTLHCIDDGEDEIARMAVEMNNGLLEMVQTLKKDTPVDKLVDNLLQAMQSRDSMVVRTACLQWICMLLSQRKAEMLQRGTLDRLFAPIFDTLLHPDDEVVAAALTVLAQVMEGRVASRDDLPPDPSGQADSATDLFTVVTHRLLRLFASNRDMFESRGRLMIRQLCGHLDSRRLYVTVARTIQEERDLELAQLLVQTFSWILLTAIETKNIREELFLTPPISALMNPIGDQPTPLFVELIEPWFHNPVSALALCLWSQQYELASELTARLAAFEPTLDLLRQLDQLVHLLESPVFSRLRLRLLEPRRHPALLKTLLGLAMLLPQAGAFNMLRQRISMVQSCLLLEAQRDDAALAEASLMASKSTHTSKPWWGGSGSSANVTAGGAAPSGADLESLLKRFDEVKASRQD